MIPEITKRKQLSASLRMKMPMPSAHPVEISHIIPDPTNTIKKFMGWNEFFMSRSLLNTMLKELYQDYASDLIFKSNPFLKMIKKTEKS